jgi:hypothetical protein
MLRVPGLADLRLPRAAARFPDWVRPISWVLAPTWGMNAIRESALGGSPLPTAHVLRLGAATSRSASLVWTACSRGARHGPRCR